MHAPHADVTIPPDPVLSTIPSPPISEPAPSDRVAPSGPKGVVGSSVPSSGPPESARAAASVTTSVWRRPIRFGLGLRLFLGFLLVLGLGDLVTAGLVDRNVAASAHAQVEERLRYEVIMLGQMTANALFGPIDPSDTSLAGVVSQLADAVHTNLSVLAVDGTVVADSDAADLKSQENQARAPEVVSALDGGTGVSVRVAGGAPRMFVAQLIARDGKPLGIARASVPMGVVDAVALAARLQMAYGGLAAAVIAMIIAGFIALGIIRPVRKLADGARKIGAGELDHRIDVRSRDEIGDLGRALNEMVGRLQSMVGALDQRNRDLRVVLDNVEQGLVTVDAEGRIADERSKAIDSWFGTPPHGTLLWDMFDEAGAPAQVKASLALGWDQLFGGMLPHELSLAQLPRRIRAGERYFELGCEPIFRDGDTLDKALVVVSDVTAVVAAELSDVEQREQLALFGAVAKDREGVADFFRSTGEIVDYVAANGTRIDLATDVKRGLHTIKGNSGLFGLTSLATLCHDIETRVAEGELVGAEETVTKDDCEALARAWASLVARGHDLLGNLPSSAIDVSQQDIAALVVAIQRGARSDALIRTIATWSLDPAEKRLSRLALQAQQLAARMGKAGVTVEVEPSTVRLPTDRWAPFWGSLAHVVRNALDHGIEAAEERASAGKPGNGRLKLSARESADEVVVEIADDGRGIQWARVREKARAAGLLATTDADLVHALFADGVSTAELATEYSGRGVGMSAVRAACESLGGQVDVVSVLGVGTTMRFRFPRPGMGDSLTKLAGVVSVPPPPRSVSVPRMVASVDA